MKAHEEKEKKPKRTWQEELYTFKHCAVENCTANSDRFKGQFSKHKCRHHKNIDLSYDEQLRFVFKCSANKCNLCEAGGRITKCKSAELVSVIP